MKNPAPRGRVLGNRSGEFDRAEFTLLTHQTQRAGRAIAAGLICLPHPIETAFILRGLDLNRRIWLSISSILALPADDAKDIAEAALADIDAWRESPVEIEIEIERQRSAWTNSCRGRSRRPTPTSTEKRRATKICFDDTPREALAAAWVGATDRDRRDLIERVTGSVSDGL